MLPPDRIHLTVPRTRCGIAILPHMYVHTTFRPLGPEEIITVDGIRLTSAARSIVDVADADLAPDQVERAVANALARGLANESELREQARQRGGRVVDQIDRALRGIRSVEAAPSR